MHSFRGKIVRVLGVGLLIAESASSVAHADVHMVTCVKDLGPGSLRQCVEDALPGDEIRFDPSLDGRPIVLGDSLLIDKDLTITGRGADASVLDGNYGGGYAGGFSALRIDPGIEVTVSGVTIRGGRATRGPAIVNRGRLTLNASTIRENLAGDWWGHPGKGGGIFNDGELTVNDCAVVGNLADPGRWGAYALGGAIYNQLGILFVNRSRIDLNLARAWLSDASGGAIYSDGGTVVIYQSTVNANEVTSWGGEATGGALHAVGGTVVCHDSVIRDNVAVATARPPWYSGEARGGGVRASASAVLTVRNTTISGNRALHDRSGGGGISNQGGTVTLDHSTISGNSAQHGAGVRNDGTTIITNSTVVGDSATGYGGVVYQRAGLLSLQNSVLGGQSDGTVCRGAIVSYGHNLDSDGSCGFNHHTDLPNTDPLLGPLQDNGGPTLTHAPLDGSPLIDRGECIAPTGQVGGRGFGLPLTDQRGVHRPIDGDQDGVLLCDIGAVEHRPPPVFQDVGTGDDEDERWPDPD